MKGNHALLINPDGTVSDPNGMCLWPACERDAGPEGYCDLHREPSRAELEALEMRIAQAKVAALRDAARRVVNAERRARWRKQEQKAKSRRRMAKESRKKR